MYSYSVVEEVLARSLKLKPEERTAFAARLRHLRNLGVPQSKPGTGKRLPYSLRDVQQMLFALMLESIGCAPRLSVYAVQSFWEGVGDRALPNMMVVLPDGRARPITVDRLSMLLRNEHVMAVLNVANACAQLAVTLRTVANA